MGTGEGLFGVTELFLILFEGLESAYTFQFTTASLQLLCTFMSPATLFSHLSFKLCDEENNFQEKQLLFFSGSA